MSGFTERQASGASETPGRSDIVFTWTATQNMLPLVQRIAADLVESWHRLQQLTPEKESLDRRRLQLAWPERQRRYRLTEEVTAEEAHLKALLTELEGLGLAVIDPEVGQIGFPTMVNNRRAYFSWRPGEEGVNFWHFADSSIRRTVPAAWKEPIEKLDRKPGKSRRE